MAQAKGRSSGSSTKKKSSGSSRKPPAQNTSQPFRRELGGVVCLFAGVFAFIGYFTSGYWMIDAVSLYVYKGLFGWGFYAAAPSLFFASYILFFHGGKPVKARLWAVLSIPMIVGAIVHMIVCGAEYSMRFTSPGQYYTTGLALRSGGLISSYLSEILRQALSAYGAIPILVFLFMACCMIAMRISVKDLFTKRERKPYVPVEEEKQPESAALQLPAELPDIFEKSGKKKRSVRPVDIDVPLDEEEPPKKKETAKKPEPQPVVEEKEEKRRPLRKKKKTEEEEASAAPTEDIPPMPAGLEAARKLRDQNNIDQLFEDMSAEEPQPKKKRVTASELVDVPLDPPEGESEKMSKAELRSATREVAAEITDAEVPDTYVYPPLDLLNESKSGKVDAGGELAANQERLELALKSFGVGAHIIGYTRGPSITRYELELDAGLRLTKLTNLAGDLALSLGVSSVRIAPIPGRVATVGIEVPNKLVSTVYLREVLDTPGFRSAKSALSFAIGKDIAGNCIVGNISKLPHLLIAGTTGSGKSVCMNSLILSLLYKSSPDEVRLIMIDPKMVELGIYNGIPHLYIPVVTDPKKAAGALQWSVVEMMKRYRLFSENGVRDIAGYNEILKKREENPLPNLVIVIDELADLMMTAAKEVEESICRVAQMGRAAGVHLVIATQRPSADVITGLMKANIPSRIAFAVSSSLESRIILDKAGAEKLVGNGDMLYSPIGLGEPQRIQGAFVSDEEREQVINFIKAGGEAEYDQSAIADIERAAAEKDKEKDKGAPRSAIADEIMADQEDNPFAGYDELLPQAVDVILDTKQASVSMLQRRLKLGYSRAARLVDQMEELGIVGPFEGSKPRQLLIDRQKWQEMSLSGRTPMERLIDEQKDDFSEARTEDGLIE